jgi:hypothetical protein
MFCTEIDHLQRRSAYEQKEPPASESGCGLILQIGRWVLREACRQARAWRDAGLPPVPITVNVSVVEFRDKGFVESVRTSLTETGLEGRYLGLELTEGVLMEDAESTAAVFQELKVMGGTPCGGRPAICPITSDGYSGNCRPLRGRTSLYAVRCK